MPDNKADALVDKINAVLKRRSAHATTHWDGCESDPRHDLCALGLALRGFLEQEPVVDPGDGSGTTFWIPAPTRKP